MLVAPRFLRFAIGLLLTGQAAAAASAGPNPPLAGARHVELRADHPARTYEVRIGPGLSTTLFFDSEILSERVELEGRERFFRIGVAADHLAFIPSSAMRQGERLRLVVRFRDGALPEHVVLMLVVVAAAHAERQVEFYRAPRTAESYRQEVDALQAEVRRLQEQLELLRPQHDSPTGVDGATASLVELGSKCLSARASPRVGGSIHVSMQAVTVICQGGRRDLQVMLQVNGTDKNWRMKKALLVDGQGRVSEADSVLQSEPFRDDGPTPILVLDVDLKSGETYTLRLSDESERRTLELEGLVLQ